jgi:hypothetical protein
MTDLVILTPDGRLQIWRDGRVAWEVQMTPQSAGRLAHACGDYIHREAVQMPVPAPVQPWDV